MGGPENPQVLDSVKTAETIKPQNTPDSKKGIEDKATATAKSPEKKSTVLKSIIDSNPDLNTYKKGKESELKAILEGKENNERNTTKSDILREQYSIDSVEGYANKIKKQITENGGSIVSKKDVEKARLEVNKSIYESRITKLDENVTDKDGNTLKDEKGKIIKKSVYNSILENNKNLAKFDTIRNPEFTKNLLAVYGEKKIETSEEFFKFIKEGKNDFPNSVLEYDNAVKLFEEYKEQELSKKNTLKGETINKITNSKGENVPINSPLKNGTTSTSSYKGDSYKMTSNISENVNIDNIDSEINSLSKVENKEDDKKLLEGRGLSEHNKELIFNRIPAKWFDVAVAFAKKEGKDISKDTPISLASRSKKRGLISYPNGTSEETPVITADKGKGKTDIMDTVFHFGGVKIAGINKSAALSYNSHTTLGASIQSPEGVAEGGKWWHGVVDGRFANGHTFGCVGIKQEVAIRLARSVQNSGKGYGYLVQ